MILAFTNRSLPAALARIRLTKCRAAGELLVTKFKRRLGSSSRTGGKRPYPEMLPKSPSSEKAEQEIAAAQEFISWFKQKLQKS